MNSAFLNIYFPQYTQRYGKVSGKKKDMLSFEFLKGGISFSTSFERNVLLFIFFLKNFGMDISTFSTPKMLLMEIN